MPEGLSLPPGPLQPIPSPLLISGSQHGQKRAQWEPLDPVSRQQLGATFLGLLTLFLPLFQAPSFAIWWRGAHSPWSYVPTALALLCDVAALLGLVLLVRRSGRAVHIRVRTALMSAGLMFVAAWLLEISVLLAGRRPFSLSSALNLLFPLCFFLPFWLARRQRPGAR